MWRGCANGWYTTGLNEECSARSLRLELLISLSAKCQLTSLCSFVPFIFVSANCLEIFETENCLEMLHVSSVFLIDSRIKIEGLARSVQKLQARLRKWVLLRGGKTLPNWFSSDLTQIFPKLAFDNEQALPSNNEYIKRKKYSTSRPIEELVSAVFSTPRRGLRKAGVSSEMLRQATPWQGPPKQLRLPFTSCL